MKVLLFSSSAKDEVSRICVQFGSGLIGSSITSHLQRSASGPPIDLPISWDDRHLRLEHLELAQKELTRISPETPIDIIWAAGKTGFYSSSQEATCERIAFVDICNWVALLNKQRSVVHFHILSSAGGLFEGQRFIDSHSIAAPNRPYGELKLEQEKLAQLICSNSFISVYRPSSVYGIGGRSGLVTTLLMNSKAQIPSRIFGEPDTIRDYILADDIGHFISRQIKMNTAKSGLYILASGRPATLFEVIQIIKRAVGRPFSFTIDPRPTNAKHITYRKSALPINWYPTDLETGIRKVAREISRIYEISYSL